MPSWAMGFDFDSVCGRPVYEARDAGAEEAAA